MEKMDMHSQDFSRENIDKIGELFPNCIVEAKDEEGILRKSIDFDQLRQELSDSIAEGPQERYMLNWPGKREALLTANAPMAKTLRPCREESVNFDTTENLFIEGDNLDALKLMQDTYLGKIKMIYIDPPYNTGNDFVYEDDFAESTEEFLKKSNQKDEEGNRLVTNSESNGRFHSDWLSMMYPRLKLSRNLLKDDGVIFISIDDNEIENLKKICNEVFGEKNFVCNIVVNRASEIASNNTISKHEYVLVYSRNILNFEVKGIVKNTISRGTVGNRDQTMPIIEFPQGLKCVNIEDGVYEHTRKIEGSQENIENLDKIIVKNGKLYNNVRMKARWRSSNDMRNFFNNECKPTPAKISGLIEEIYFDGDRFMPQIKKKTFEKISSIILGQKRGSNDLSLLGMNMLFDFPKSVRFIYQLSSYIKFDNSDIILDFFAGSATTAHAVMQLNAEDGGNRKFIMVQLPEACDEKSEAFKAGYKNIAEIAKERIRRAGKKIKEESGLNALDLDIGFRVLKVDSSNMQDVYYNPDDYSQDLLTRMTDNIKTDRSKEDLLFQILLDWGVDLSLPITKKNVAGNEVLFVSDNALAACFVNKGEITEDFCKELATYKPLRVVFRDAGFQNDSMKINVEQIFKLLSPNTEIKTI
jgi:adenine-specific DNA-methyltransferase